MTNYILIIHQNGKLNRMNNIADYYKKDLAYIHDIGFSDFALKSAPSIIEILQENNIRSGLIVDLGCGSGLSAQEFIKANYLFLRINYYYIESYFFYFLFKISSSSIKHFFGL